MATSYDVRHSQDAQLGIKHEATFGTGLDVADADTQVYRRIPMAEAPKPTFNFQRESRMLSGRGSIKDAGDTLLITKGGTVTCPFDFIATPELLLQHLVMVGQEFNDQTSNVYDVEFDSSSNLQSIGGAVSGGLPHTVNLAYMPNSAGAADGIKVVGALCSDLSIKGDYGTNSGCITMSGNYWSGFSNIQEGNGAGTRSEVDFTGTWVDPDENVFFHMGDLKTKTLQVEAGSALEMIVKGFEINISNNVQAIGGDGSGNPEMYTMPQFDITGSLTLKHDANFDLGTGTNVLSSYVNKNTMGLALKFGDNTVSTVGEMNIAAEIQITGDPTVDNSDQGVFWNLPFECLYNSADTLEALKIQLFSDTAPSAM